MNIVVYDIGNVVDLIRPKWLDLPGVKAMIDAGKMSDQSPFYMYGHRREIANVLTLKSKDSIEKFKRYPLIALRLDIPERITGKVSNYTLNLAIVHLTKDNYYAPDRYEKVFEPILYPLYDLFMQGLRDVGGFWWTGMQDRPDHTKIDRPYYGTQASEGNTKKLFNDPLDAIEIIDLKVSKYNKC